MPRARCAGCSAWVDTRGTGVAELVKGYRVNRQQGGANQITLPVSLGRWLCAGCLAVARGADVDQASLF